MSLTAPGMKGVVTDFMSATPSATVALQAVSSPGAARHTAAILFSMSTSLYTDMDGMILRQTLTHNFSI